MKKMNIMIKALGASSCLLLLASFFLSACSSTDEDFFYQDEPRVRLVGENIWAAGTDSVMFSFVAFGSDVVEKAIMVDAQIMGEVADHDRVVNLAIDQSLSTAEAAMYECPSTVTIPAREAKGTFSVVLKRVAALQTKTARLYIKVAESADFKPGVNEENHIVMIWNDILSRPNNWDTLQPYFGEYSNTKYRFMLVNSGGISEFSTDTMSWAQLMSLKIRFQNALNEYNAAHPGNPLTDENGNLVTFE